MGSPILVTKLFIPATRSELVSRLRLIDQLNNGLHRKLTLISAPAGFGKTTLTSHWLESLQNNQGPTDSPLNIAWLSLDEDDNDLVRFFSHLIASLNRAGDHETEIGRGALAMLQAPQPPSGTEVLTLLINDLAVTAQKIILVLDDYHLIEAQSIHQAITYFIENLPPELHLVIATRHDPPLSLGRMRARDQMTELRAADLRFSSSEAADFLNQVMGLNLSAEEISELETRTEGWIAGLQLAAISLQGRIDSKDFIASFSGGHRLVLDFLIEEVLGRQPQRVKDFLLQTAILNRLTGPLCEALTGQENSQQILEDLDRANIFIVPLDEERQWYRYHHLFRDLLRQRLQQALPEQVNELHLKASNWYKQNGVIGQAIEHALMIRDFEEVASLISERFDDLWDRGNHNKLRTWLNALPQETLINYPQLGSICAYYLHIVGQHQKGRQLLQEVEQVLKGDNGFEPDTPVILQISEIERTRLLGRIAVLKALIDSSLGDVQGMIGNARQALETLPEDDLTWRSIVTFSLGDAYSFLGNMKQSFQVRSEAVHACEAAGNPYYVIMANLKLASTLREQGKLKQTAELCEQQIAIGKELGFSENNSIGYLMTLLGEILVEWNDCERGIELAKRGVEISDRQQNFMILSFCYLILLRVLFSCGDLDGVDRLVKKAFANNPITPMAPWLPDQLAIWQVRRWLARGEIEPASSWQEEKDLNISDVKDLPAEFDYHSMFMYIASARIMIAEGRLEHSIGLLQHLIEAAEEADRITSLIETRMLLALGYQAGGDIEQALGTLEQALGLAQVRGYFRIFVDEGPPMAGLLYEALKRGIAPDYVQRLLAAFPVAETEEEFPTKDHVDQSGLIEPLSEREIEVLQLLAKGLTNQAIAEWLFLSPHTVKTHTRNIYSKLTVNNRTQAIDRARTLGILSFSLDL